MEILGLLDTLESVILDGFKIPLTKKTIVNEEELLSIIDKIRLVIQGGGDFAKKAIGGEEGIGVETKEGAKVEEGEGVSPESKAEDLIQQAYQMAKEIREGADKYADEVLANLEAATTRILRTLKAGRERLTKTKGES